MKIIKIYYFPMYISLKVSFLVLEYNLKTAEVPRFQQKTCPFSLIANTSSLFPLISLIFISSGNSVCAGYLTISFKKLSIFH